LGPSPAGIQQLRKAIDVFPTSKAIDTLVSFHISQGWLLFHIRNVVRDHLSSRKQKREKRRLHVNATFLYFVLTGDYVAALQILSEFVEFVEAYVAAGARGNYNATLHRYTRVNKDVIYTCLYPSILCDIMIDDINDQVRSHASTFITHSSTVATKINSLARSSPRKVRVGRRECEQW
jgi:hypothetical protein